MEIVVLLLVVFGVMMYLAQRRQKREARAVTTMQDSLAPGDLVMTTSGLHGTVVDLDDDTVDLEIAEDVVTTWNRLAIRQRVVETPASADVTGDEPADELGAAELDAAELPARSASTTGPRLTKD